MKRLGWYLLILAVCMACKSPPPAEPVFEEHWEEAGPAADSVTVSQEVYDYTLAEVKQFVDGLNALIRSKNYNSWKDALSDELFATLSSPEFLAKTSESAALKSRKIVLKTPSDYFLQVVVPSRSNSKVDEIEFTAADRVKVFYLEERVRRTETNEAVTETRRLRLYDLVKTGDTWKIID